jgi:predicted GNAT family acetyltransferase
VHPLDNVIWCGLTTRQTHLGSRDGAAARFHPEVSVLAGLEAPSADGYTALARMLGPSERAGLFVDVSVATPGLAIVSAIPLLQMVHAGDEAPPVAPAVPVALLEGAVPEMMALAELARPGPFARRTREMGDYFGLRHEGALIAMAGERLHVPGHTEISAVCTHPDHLGRGHAATLTALMIARILARGERPFLHVRADNARAIALYERLGFSTRLRQIYAILERTAGPEGEMR